MNLYRLGTSFVISPDHEPGLEMLRPESAEKHSDRIYCINSRLSPQDRMQFRINDAGQYQMASEGVSVLNRNEPTEWMPPWLQYAILEGRVVSINGSHEDWKERIIQPVPKQWRIHAVGLGDVGGILLTGLKLLGGKDIRRIGIYDPGEDRIQRWLRELGQICWPFEPESDIPVEAVAPDKLFDCDLFVFCASKGVPPLESGLKDVRNVQFEGNAAILAPYVKMACEAKFRGLFAIVSDPVDHLSRFVLQESARNGGWLKPEQVRGYGLGVMNGRAMWYAAQNPQFSEYCKEGRAYGPHGKGLIIANSIKRFSEEKSDVLTELTENANHEVRNAGFKPYVAPALSSGAISLLKTIRGEWHYSAVSLGGVFMGCCNRFVDGIQETEVLSMPEKLMERLQETWNLLEKPL